MRIIFLCVFFLSLMGCKDNSVLNDNIYFNKNDERIIKINEKTMASKYELKKMDLGLKTSSINIEMLDGNIYFLDNKNFYLKKIKDDNVSTVIPLKIKNICLMNNKIIVESDGEVVSEFLKGNNEIIKKVKSGKCNYDINNLKKYKNNDLLISESENEDGSVKVDLYYDNYSKYEKNKGRLKIVINYINEGKTDYKEYSMSLNLNNMINFDDDFNYQKINGEIKNNNGFVSFRVLDYMYIIKFKIKENNLELKDVEKIKIDKENVFFKNKLKIHKIKELKDSYVGIFEIDKKTILVNIKKDKMDFILSEVKEVKIDNNKCNLIVKKINNDLKLINTCS